MADVETFRSMIPLDCQFFNKSVDFRQSEFTQPSLVMRIASSRSVTMILSEAKKFHAYARECLQLAEQATEPDIRKHLIELSHIWMEAALKEERHILYERAHKAVGLPNP